MANPIIACGVDSATLQTLADQGLVVSNTEPEALAGAIDEHPDAVLLAEGLGEGVIPFRDSGEEGSPLKVILILNAEASQIDFGEALKRHLFGIFRRPLDMDSLVESIREAQAIHSWSDGIQVLSARPNWLTLGVRCRLFTAERLVRFVQELVSDLNAEEREKTGTAFREIVLNGMEHGASFDASKQLHVSCLRTSRFVMYTVRDPGPGFSFDNLPHAAISNPPENPAQHMLHRAQQGIRAGGFGLMVARDLVDEMLHNEAGNEVVLIKYLRSESD